MASNPQSSGAQPLRPPLVGSAGPPQNFGPPMSMQFRPVVPAQQQFFPAASQQFRSLGQGISVPNVGISSQPQHPQFSQPPPLPPRPGQPTQGPPSSQAIPAPYNQPNRPITSGPIQPQQGGQPLNSHLPGVGMPLSSSYTFATSYGQPQNVATSQHQPISQMHATVMPMGSQPWMQSGGQNVPLGTPMLLTSQLSSVAAATAPATNVPAASGVQSSSDWQEHTAADGRRYYYNKKTRQSSWEKPLELMTPMEMSFGTSGEIYDCSICSLMKAGFLFSQGRQHC